MKDCVFKSGESRNTYISMEKTIADGVSAKTVDIRKMGDFLLTIR